MPSALHRDRFVRAARPPPDNLTDAYAQNEELEGNVMGIAEMRVIALMVLMDVSIVNAASLTKYRRLGGFCKHIRAELELIDIGRSSARCVSPDRACFMKYRISRISKRYPLTSEILAVREVSTCKIPLSVEFMTGTRYRRPT